MTKCGVRSGNSGAGTATWSIRIRAIAYLGSKRVDDKRPVVFLATAHPAKFREVVEPIIGREVPLPAALAEALGEPRRVEQNRAAPRRSWRALL